MAHRPHARLAPSSASRWLRCPASVQFIEDEELDDESGVPAKEGTILHMLCEECLRDDITPYKFVGQTFEFEGHHMEFTDQLADWMEEGLDYLDDIPGRIFIEKRLDLGRWMPGQFGTMDVGIIGRKRATLFDWKWGFLPVGAVDNDQLRIYALGFWDNYVRHLAPHIRKFRLIIWQPRAPGGGGEWDIDIDELLEWGEKLKVAAKLTYKKDAKFIPGTTQCAYCPGATNLVCAAYKAFNKELLDLDDEEMDEEIEMGLPLRLSSDGMTPERRSHIIAHRTMINKFLDRLAAEELDDALKGRPTPGRKAVDGRNPARRWFDPDQAEKELGLILSEGEAFTRKLISPTQLEKIVSEAMYKRLEKELVDLGNPKIVMVPEGDRRPPVANIKDELND